MYFNSGWPPLGLSEAPIRTRYREPAYPTVTVRCVLPFMFRGSKVQSGYYVDLPKPLADDLAYRGRAVIE